MRHQLRMGLLRGSVIRFVIERMLQYLQDKRHKGKAERIEERQRIHACVIYRLLRVAQGLTNMISYNDNVKCDYKT